MKQEISLPRSRPRRNSNPKKDRAFSTSLWNAGATVGALAAPLIIPPLALHFGWEAAFVVIGALGFIWMGFWVFMYHKPEVHPRINAAGASLHPTGPVISIQP